MDKKKKYILALDIGTSIIRCSIKDTPHETKATVASKLQLLYPQNGFVEIDPEHLWNSVTSLMSKVVLNSKVDPQDIAGIGISTQRGTFITWRKDNGQHFHNFITWKDLRADGLVQGWNKAVTIKALRFISYCLYLLTKNKRYLTGSGYKLSNIETTLRLVWIIQNIPELRYAIRKNNAMFGTIETWLVYRLTNGQTYVTDITNASATGLFDPFCLQWNTMLAKLFKIPFEIFPAIVNNDHDFGIVDKRILGAEIPIHCVMADQSSSMFGSCCFDSGDLKLTLGTGSFLNVNTGSEAHGSQNGIYPLVAWKFNDGELVFMSEASANDTGSLVEWMIQAEIIKDPVETSSLAEKSKENDGVYFVPAFSGLGVPINDANAASGFIGVRPTTKRHHMVRAVMESIVFRIFLLYDLLRKERPDKYRKIRVDGGVSKNNFICASLASISNLAVERTYCVEMSTQGVTLIAGLKAGLWSRAFLKQLEQSGIFHPDPHQHQYYEKEIKEWLRAVDRFKAWV